MQPVFIHMARPQSCTGRNPSPRFKGYDIAALREVNRPGSEAACLTALHAAEKAVQGPGRPTKSSCLDRDSILGDKCDSCLAAPSHPNVNPSVESPSTIGPPAPPTGNTQYKDGQAFTFQVYNYLKATCSVCWIISIPANCVHKHQGTFRMLSSRKLSVPRIY